uniref:Uncharacterized protein n=1 Tax=Arundo donax TaxID=35708 RepID=A0A0A9D6X1_ARUDO
MMKGRRRVMVFPLFLCGMVCFMAQLGAANVVLMGNNLTLSFDDIEASFGKFLTSYSHLALADYQLLLLPLDATLREAYFLVHFPCLCVQLMFGLLCCTCLFLVMCYCIALPPIPFWGLFILVP